MRDTTLSIIKQSQDGGEEEIGKDNGDSSKFGTTIPLYNYDTCTYQVQVPVAYESLSRHFKKF